MRLEVNREYPEPHQIGRAVAELRKGEVIGYPTDTRYGVGCALGHKKAVDRIYQMTGKSRKHPLTILVPDLSDIARYAVVENPQYRLLKRVLPGAYTFVLPATREVPRMLTQKRKTIGIRVPDHPVVQAVLASLDGPLVSTSASWQGEDPLDDPADIVARFKDLALVLDAGYGGMQASTMVDLTGAEPEIVREGAGPTEEIV